MSEELVAEALRCHRQGALERAEKLYGYALTLEPASAHLWYLLGTVHQSHGNLIDAGECYRHAVTREPALAEAWTNLGLVLEQRGRADEALTCFQQSADLQPRDAAAANRLGAALAQRGRMQEAVAAFRAAVWLVPTFAEAHRNLGSALRGLGQFDEALASWQQALALQPTDVEALRQSALVLMEQHKPREAEHRFRQVVQFQPRSAEARNNLGISLMLQNRLEDAAASLRAALDLRPGSGEMECNLGEVRERQGHWAEAERHYRTALQWAPKHPIAWNNLGNLCWKTGRAAEAERCFRQALELLPQLVDAHNNLGVVVAARGEPDLALTFHENAVRLNGAHPESLNNLGNAYKDQGRMEESIACYRRVVDLHPHHALAHSNLLYALHFDARYDAESIFAEHRRWAARHAGGIEAVSHHEHDRTSGRRLRIGYVSPDFRRHVMGFYFDLILGAHDRTEFEIFAYAQVARPDALTQRLRERVDSWRSLVGMSDAKAAQLVRADKIDVLVDLAGHTADHRLLLFAHKPAPVQVTHFGYADTTGLRTMDYRLTDERLDPPGAEQYHTEQLFRMPVAASCYNLPEMELRDVPCQRHGHVTFGSLNSLAKVSPEILAVWSRILTALPSARLLALTGAGRLGDQRILELFERNGVARERIHFVGRRGREDYLRLYHDVDVCLDTFPFTGMNTTVDALWMGVPVVSLAGGTTASRQSASVLGHLGLDELIATTPEEYVSRALHLANRPDCLQVFRRETREMLRNSSLTDARSFTAHLETAYREVWLRWCADQGRPPHAACPRRA